MSLKNLSYEMNVSKPSGYFTFNTKELYVRLTERIYDLLHCYNYILGNYLIGSYNRDGICLLCGTNGIFRYR
jgi:hypothetical protein